MNITITKHALDRFSQRFKLRVNKAMWNRSGYNHMIQLMFSKSIRSDLRIRNQIGLYNSLCVRYGGKVEYYTYNEIVFACIRTKEQLILRTVFSEGNQI